MGLAPEGLCCPHPHCRIGLGRWWKAFLPLFLAVNHHRDQKNPNKSKAATTKPISKQFLSLAAPVSGIHNLVPKYRMGEVSWGKGRLTLDSFRLENLLGALPPPMRALSPPSRCHSHLAGCYRYFPSHLI